MNRIYRRWIALPSETRAKYTKLIYLLVYISTVTIIYLFCRTYTSHFHYEYEVGKPWKYDLLTVDENIPILLTERDVDKQMKKAMPNYVPFYNVNYKEQQKCLNHLSQSASMLDDEDYQALRELTENVYQQGIIDLKTWEGYVNDGVKKICIIDSNSVLTNRKPTDIYTVATAYEYLSGQCKALGVDAQQIHLDKCISISLTLDQAKSEYYNRQILNVPTERGDSIQKGESIINKGDIVTEDTYRKLESVRAYVDSNTTMRAKHANNVWEVIGRLFIIVGLLTLMVLYLYLFRPRIYHTLRSVVFILSFIAIMVGLTSAVISHTALSAYVVPFTLVPILVRAFFDSRTALFVHTITVLLTSLLVANPYLFILLQLTAGMVALSTLKQMSRRSQLVSTAALIFTSYATFYTGYVFFTTGEFVALDWTMYPKMLVSTLLIFFAYVLIFILEKIYGFLSDVSLIELSNINNKLLMDFSSEAPGSFQHVLQVANLAATCAAAIDANVLLSRTGALYHDIGKKNNPMLFTENQGGGASPLSSMSYDVAAQVIISHVNEGVKIAKRAGLPGQIIRFIRTHHAKSKTKYFYNSFKNEHPDEPIDESKFTYPGPLPESKEEAIVMITDAVEAASRSLPIYNEQTIGALVDKIIDGQIAEGSLCHSIITFRDIHIIRKTLRERLLNIYHSRISYPDLKVKEESKNTDAPTTENMGKGDS